VAAVSSDHDALAGVGPFNPVSESIAEPVGTDDDLAVDLSGASGTRTHDLPAASRTLSQLSYSPESVFPGKVNAGSLAVLGRIDPQADRTPSFGYLDRHQENLFELSAIHGHRIDLIVRISASDVSGRRMTRPADTNADHTRGPIQRTPLALDTNEPCSEVEDQVVPAVFTDGLQDVDAELDRLEGDRGLGDVPLLVGAQHLAILARVT
jgi:hypothetical protein